MTVTSIATRCAAPAGLTTGLAAAYISPPAPMFLTSIPTGAGADVHIYQDPDGSLSSDCTGCGEYAWTLVTTQDFAEEHAATCLRPPRRRAA
ncbi:hypothetical protein [Streptomyces sp. NPDC026589]|uniref:hypothetical protein n=1 Tax=Streptomyces sp. NPDC026589 TaxID=3155609 RepID=UPI0034073F61